MDKLDILFEMQAKLDSYIQQERNLNYSKEEWIQKQSLALISEVTELLNEVNYKWWKNPKPCNDHAIKEELVDILHFFIGMCLKSGMTAEEMFNIYKEKNSENFNRQNGSSLKKGYELKNSCGKE